jgi:N-acetylglucosamine repressor
MKKATQQQTKEHNRNLVLQTIFENDSISRAEIARVTGLTRTTVSDIVTDLINEGLVSEIGVGSSIGGKSPILLSLVEDARYLIGVDLAHREFQGAVVNLRGKIYDKVTLPVNDRNSEDALAQVYEILDRLVSTAHQPLVGIGVGTPGLVNTREGAVVNAVNLDWKDLPLARLLQVRYHLPVYILNDSQAAAMGEYIYGKVGKGHQAESNLVVINIRHGIGAGIVVNGHLFQGDGGGAGEIGHIVVVPEGGLPCRCGNHGCLETVASEQALVKRAQLLVKQSAITQLPRVLQEINLNTIEKAFLMGDPLVREIVLEAGHYLGMAIASLIGTLNIQKIILTLADDMACFGKPWLEVIQETITKNTFSKQALDTQVEIGRLGGNSILLGASGLLVRNYSLLFNHLPPHND